MREVVGHYEGQGVVDRIDGTQPIDGVTAEIIGHLRADEGAR
jgi:hypothetical protein